MKRYSITDDSDGDKSRTDQEDIEVGGIASAADEDDSNPIDPITGEPAFDDISPRGSPPDDEDDDEADEPPVRKPKPKDDDEDDSDDSDDEDSDSKFNRRLARERRLLREARDEARETRAELAELSKIVRRKDAEGELQKAKDASEATLASLRTRLKKALEDGDTDAQVELTEQIADVKADLKAKEFEAKNAKEAEAVAKPAEQKRANRLVSQWLRKHGRYKTDAGFKAYVDAVDREVASEGFDQHSDEYYEELDSRIKERFPEEYKGQKKPEKRERISHPASGERSDDADRPARKGSFQRRGNKVFITPRQALNMRTFGLDPENKEDVRAYIRENS